MAVSIPASSTEVIVQIVKTLNSNKDMLIAEIKSLENGISELERGLKSASTMTIDGQGDINSNIHDLEK